MVEAVDSFAPVHSPFRLPVPDGRPARRVDSLAPARSAFRPARLPDGVPARRVDSLAPARSAFRPARLPDGVPARRVLFVDRTADSADFGLGSIRASRVGRCVSRR